MKERTEMNIDEIRNTIIQGDCLEVLKQLPDKCVDLVLTDIPYGEVNRDCNGLRELDKADADVVLFDLSELTEELERVCRGSVYVFCGTEQVSILRHNFVEYGLSTRLIIWEKTNPSPMNGQYIWLSGIECCVFARNKNATFNGHCRNTVLRYPCGSSILHPTEKPLAMFEDIIKTSSKEGDLVLDPFLGSGTTAVACYRTRRDFIGIEISPEYCETARKRLQAEKDKLALFPEAQ